MSYKWIVLFVTIVVIFGVVIEVVNLIQSEDPITFWSVFSATGGLSSLLILYVILWSIPKESKKPDADSDSETTEQDQKHPNTEHNNE